MAKRLEKGLSSGRDPSVATAEGVPAAGRRSRRERRSEAALARANPVGRGERRPVPHDAAPDRLRLVAWGVLIVVLTVVAYVPAMHGGFVWDDDEYVTTNLALRTLGGLARIWFEPGAVPQYYPLTFTSFWIEYHLWGFASFGFHLVNVLLHALSALLFWKLLRVLRVPGAWMAAAIFALHPMHVESVAWISERKNVLSGVFYLGAALAYLSFSPPEGTRARKEWRWYALAMALFAGALLSKTVTCSLPAALLLVLWWKRQGSLRGELTTLAPMFVLGLTSTLTTVWMERHQVGAEGAEWALSFVDRCLIAGRAVCFYIWTLLWPHPLAFIYPRWDINAAVAWQYLFPAAVLACLALAVLMRRRLGSATLIGIFFFVGTLVPALGFFDVYPMRFSFVADHFAYLATLAPIAWVCGTIAVLAAKLPRGKLAGSVAGGSILAVLGMLTWQRGYAYADLDTLWLDTVAKNPACWMAHNNLGVIALDHGRTDEAVARFTEALRLWPGYAEAHNNLGNALRAQGKHEEAVAEYREALRIEPRYAGALGNLGIALADRGSADGGEEQLAAALRMQPKSAEAHYNMGTLLLQRGRNTEAREHFEAALKIAPDHAPAHASLGVALAAEERFDEAVTQLNEALRLQPSSADAHYNLATVLFRLGRVSAANEHFAAALRVAPDHAGAHLNFALALAAQNRVDEAVSHFDAVLSLHPDDVEARYNLATVLLEHGRADEAAEHFAAVLRLAPDHAEAHNNFGALLFGQGKLAEAIGQYREAVRIRPDDADAHGNLAFVIEEDGQIQDAVIHYRTAVRLRPDSAAAHRNLGGALARVGKADESATELREADRLAANAPTHRNN
jgi:tetratricopeptide (TPR) repeat protein